MPPRIWAFVSDHAGDNGQVLALAEELGLPFDVKPLRYTWLKRLPGNNRRVSLLSLDSASRKQIEPPWPDLIIMVGPRPQPTFFDERYSSDVPRYLERQQVRPGLTGWAEVNDLRGAAPIVDRTIYDVYYVENWSLILDLKILLLTGIRIFFQRHAY